MTPRAIKSVEDLRCYLHRAMQLEHATIPPYLTALYSILPGTNFAAVGVLRTVAVEEMLHLTVAANLLNAVGGTPNLTAPDFVPRYPAYLPDGEDHFEVGLGKFSRDAVKTFLQIEQPRMAPAGKPKANPLYQVPGPTSLASCPLDASIHYYSIGEFYAEISYGFDYLHAELGAELFQSGRPERQVTSDYYYSGGGRLGAVTDIESARESVRLIVEQGEGEGGGIYDHAKELAHYFRFLELDKGQYYEPHNHPDTPTGPTLSVDWTAAYSIKPNARVDDYRDPELRAAARDFNDDYGRYLARLTDAFNGKPALLLEAVPMMFDIRNRMVQLMRFPLDDGSGLNAAPTFEIGVMAEVAS